jgi:hypothetical protein
MRVQSNTRRKGKTVRAVYGSADAPGLASLDPPTSAPGPGSSLPHLHRDWAHPSHICTGTGLIPVTSAPGLGSLTRARARVVEAVAREPDVGLHHLHAIPSDGRSAAHQDARIRTRACAAGADADRHTRTRASARTLAHTRACVRLYLRACANDACANDAVRAIDAVRARMMRARMMRARMMLCVRSMLCARE